ncbi:WbqC family protein [Salegentibacter sp. JZCK2]|uniref:WbqC family protein n=1 Tax=Salegentibacter tibetensis TaxID=2873600 RepID=UPI001CC9A5EA|nr:WbqC family protein [Salegentibacter tibetensis]MBZ9731396.1 WbqC family protein [Salegentibacter tibetensis]
MKEILIHPAYFGPVSQFVALVKADKVFFENEDNYQKQTYRNRMYIYDSNGKLLLNIPIKHRSALTGEPKEAGKHQLYKEVKIENDFEWQKQHWRALKASYQTSPFFEFYEDEIHPLYHKKFDYLLDFNYACLEFVTEALQLDLDFQKTSEYILHPEDVKDLRPLINSKRKFKFEHEEYTQVFQDKHGFLPNLSILDLIFNEGPNSTNYIEAQEFKF